MAIGDVFAVESVDDVYCIDTGMYDVAEYGAVYLVDAERPALVDTGIGTNYERVLDAVENAGVAREEIDVLLVTHVHLDHAGGAGFIADETGADVYVHPIGAPHLVDPSRIVAGTKRAVGDQWRYYVEPEPVPEDLIVEVEGGDTVDLGDRTIDVAYVPGHAPHQVAYRDRSNDTVFVADAAGIWVSGKETVRQTTPPSDFDLEQCLEDVETLRDLDPAVLAYPHFGPMFEPEAALDEYADLLPRWVASVEEKRAELADDDAVVQYFREHSDIEDVWGERKAGDEAELNTRGVLRYLDQRED